MVYEAVTERTFRKLVDEARARIQEGNYDDANSAIQDAASQIDSLFPPRNLIEKVEYLELKEKAYRTLLQLYGLFPKEEKPLPEPLPGEQLKSHVIEMAEHLGVVHHFENIEDLEDLVSVMDECLGKLRDLKR